MTDEQRENYRLLRSARSNLKRAIRDVDHARKIRKMAIDCLRQIKELIRDTEISESANRED
jgi:hypothetical protein